MAQTTQAYRQSENMQKETGSEVFAICAQIEEEISELDDEERQMFLDDLD